MTQKPIASVGPSVGRFKNADDNFTELYGGAASANTALTSLLATQTALQAAWTTYSATATGQSGVINGSSTTTAAHLAIGKTEHFTISCVLASASAATGDVLINLPSTANRSFVAFGTNITTGAFLTGIISAASTTITIFDSLGDTPGVHGNTVVISGVYEKQ